MNSGFEGGQKSGVRSQGSRASIALEKSPLLSSPAEGRGGGSSITPLVFVMRETEGLLYTHGDPSVISQHRANATSPTSQGRQTAKTPSSTRSREHSLERCSRVSNPGLRHDENPRSGA